MRTTRIITTLTALILLTLMLTACGSQPTPPGDPTTPAAATSPGVAPTASAQEAPGAEPGSPNVSNLPPRLEPQSALTSPPEPPSSTKRRTAVAAARLSGAKGEGRETLTVSGSGAATDAPDIARLTLAVSLTHDSPTTILQRINAATRGITAVAERADVDPGDIRTNLLNVRENMVYSETRREYVRKGFQGEQRTELTIRNPAAASHTLGAIMLAMEAAQKVDTTIEGLQTELENPRPLALIALENATRDLWQRAHRLANTSGREVCGLVEAQADGAGAFHQNREGAGGLAGLAAAAVMEDSMMRGGGVMEATGPFSINPGMVEETSWVTGVFSLVPAGMNRKEAGCGETP